MKPRCSLLGFGGVRSEQLSCSSIGKKGAFALVSTCKDKLEAECRTQPLYSPTTASSIAMSSFLLNDSKRGGWGSTGIALKNLWPDQDSST